MSGIEEKYQDMQIELFHQLLLFSTHLANILRSLRLLSLPALLIPSLNLNLNPHTL